MKTWRHISIASIFVVSLALDGCASERKVPPRVERGTLDLTDWDFERDGVVPLKGEWLFWWNDFVKPEHFTLDALRPSPDGLFRVPGIWTETDNPLGDVAPLPRVGHATFVLNVVLPRRDANSALLALYQRWVFSASRFILVDGADVVEVLDHGVVARDPALEIPHPLPSVGSLPLKGRHITLVWYVSNSHHARAGPLFNPILGLDTELKQKLLYERLRSIGLTGVLVIMALYHLGLFAQRRQDKGSLWFGVLCFATAVFQVVGNSFVQLIFIDPSLLYTDWTYKLYYLSMLLGCGALMSFLSDLAMARWFLRFTQIGWGISVLYALLIISSPTHVFTAYARGYEVVILIACTASIIHLCTQAWRGNRTAKVSLLGFLALATTVVNDILLTMAIIQTPLMIAYGMGIFVFAQSYILATRFSKAYKTAERLSVNLQAEVDAQTEELTRKKDQALELQEQAEVQAEKLRELDKQKTMFFQNISHELRTPLTLILNPLESASESHPEISEIGVATKNSRRLLRLVNQLLDFQKLEAGKKELDLRPINLVHFSSICGDYFSSACSTKHIEFSLTRNGEPVSESSEPVYVMGEVDALEKVVFNFLSNALKYTPKGGCIELGLSGGPARVRIYIRDTGPGISAEGIEKLFQVFSQVDASTTRAYEGTGLGLALVKSLAEQMHGKTGVDSEVGKGSTFWAEFPICDTPEVVEVVDFAAKDWLLADSHQRMGETDTGVFRALEEVSDGAGELVLVVDDLPDMREFIGATLKKKNYRVATSPNGKIALIFAKEYRPDLIVTDWMMPHMSGPELIEAIRDNEELRGTPMVLLTAKSDEESKIIGTGIGADAFLGKPFNSEELTSTVRNLLQLKTGEKEIQRLNTFLTESVLKRYLPPSLITEIIDGHISMDRPAELRHVTVLFSDLCGFTKKSEVLGPQAIAELLNEYLTTMNDIIFDHGGTIDKFIGDAVMVMFGAPKDMPPEEQVERACACAQDMQRAMVLIAKAWELRGAGDLKMRIGIHRGDAVVGNFGSDKRSDYTCIGPTVNLASRIEGACEPGTVLVSETVFGYLSDTQATRAGGFSLKGVDAEQSLYCLAK